MSEDHVSHRLLLDFLEDKLTSADAENVLRHLLARCPECERIARQVAAEHGATFADGMIVRPSFKGIEQFMAAFEESLLEVPVEEKRLARERLRAEGLWSLLAPLSAERRLAIVRVEARFHSLGLFDRLLGECRDVAFRDPAAAVDLAHLALAVHERLEAGAVQPDLLADRQAEALGALGNAKCLAADFEGATAAFEEAKQALARGSGEPLAEANLVSLVASLHGRLGHFEDAAALLDRAVDLYRQAGDEQRLGRTRLKQAIYIGWRDPERGLAFVSEALSLIRVEDEPRLEISARHNLIWLLNDAGRPEQALALLELSRPLYAQFSDPWTQLRLRWLEGRINRSLGHLAEAEHTFRRVAQGLAEHGMRFESVLANVDLAEALAQQQRFADAKLLCREVGEMLASWRLHTELLAVWQVFGDAFMRRSVQQKLLEAEVYRGVREYLRRHWHRPERIFVPER